MMHEFMKHQVWCQTLQVCHQLARYVSLLCLPPTPTWYLSPLPQGNRTQIRDSPWQGSCLQRKSTQWMNSFMMQSCKVSWLYLDIVNFIFGTEYTVSINLYLLTDQKIQSQRNLQSACSTGMVWTCLHHAVLDEFPELGGLIQSAANASQQVAQSDPHTWIKKGLFS